MNEVILKLEAERARLFFKHERTGKPSEGTMSSIHAMILRVKKAKVAFEKEVWDMSANKKEEFEEPMDLSVGAEFTVVTGGAQGTDALVESCARQVGM